MWPILKAWSEQRQWPINGILSDISAEEWKDILTALTPAGSISGAPKSSALKTIKELEDRERGPYCGVIGWSQGDQAVMSVGIRIFWSNQDGKINFGTGAGITWQSDPTGEWEETELKAKRLMAIAGDER
jgi:para-aminobenzoate synthetase component 1